MERFFSRDQKNNGSHVCEMGACTGRCKAHQLEADHALAFSKGGETTDENMIILGTICHAVKHLMDEDYHSAQLIVNRMNDEEWNEFLSIVASLSYPLPKRG